VGNSKDKKWLRKLLPGVFRFLKTFQQGLDEMTSAGLVDDVDVRSEGKGVELEEANKRVWWIWRREEEAV
jgi:hypothetical protein